MDPFRKVKMAVRNVVPGFNLFDSAPDPSEGERLLALGNFAEAEQFFLRVLDQLGERGHRRLSHSKILFALANSRFHQKKYNSAKEAATSTLEHLDAAKPTLELADTHDLLASIYNELKEPENAVPHLEKALDAQNRIKPIDNGAIINRRRKLGTAMEGIGKSETALEHFREAASVALRECGPEHQLTGDCEADLGRCLVELKDFKEAVEHLQTALKAHLITPGSESEEVAKDYQLLATAYQETEDLETAVLFYEKALRLRERQLGGSSADYATLLMSFASAQSLRGSYGSAVELLQQAVGKFESVRDDRLGPALESLGTVYVLSGRVDDGITSLKRARKIWEAQPEQNRERLSANTQLFETVSGYLNPRDAKVLMQSINATESAYEQRPERPKEAKRAEPKPEAARVIDTEAMYEPAPQSGRTRQPVTPLPGFDPTYPSYLPPEFGGLPQGAQVPGQVPNSGPRQFAGAGPSGPLQSYTLESGSAGGGGGNSYYMDAGGPGPGGAGYYVDPGGPGAPSSGGSYYVDAGAQGLPGGAGGPGGQAGSGYYAEMGGPGNPAGSGGYAVEPGTNAAHRGSAPGGGAGTGGGYYVESAPGGAGGWYGTTADGIPVDPELSYLRNPVNPAPLAPTAQSATPAPVHLAPDGLPSEPTLEKSSPVLADMLALRDALTPTPPPVPPARSASLSGWDEMAFDFLPN